MRAPIFRNKTRVWARKFKVLKIRKISSLVDFHSLYQLIHACKYTVIVLKYEFLTLKFVLTNEGESSRKLPKIFACKNLQMTQRKIQTLI